MFDKNKSIYFFILFSILLNNAGYSQKLNLLMTPSEKNQFAFSFDKPFFDGDDITSTLTGVYQLYCNIPISSKFNLIGTVPFINFSYQQDYYFYNQNYHIDYSENGVGNIFIGMQTRPELNDGRGSVISFGVFLPTADEDVSFVCAFVNYYNILKYIPNYLGLYFNFAHYKSVGQGFNYGIEVGPNILIPTEGKNDEIELFLHYAAGAGFRSNIFELNAEFLGIGIVTDDEEDLNERLIHQLSFGALLHFEYITPKLFYRLYVNEHMEKMIDGVLGIGVVVELE